MQLTRGYSGPLQDWELSRGFRLQVLEPGWFALFLGARSLKPDEDSLGQRPGAQEESFLVGLPPRDATAVWLETGRNHLARLAWTRGVVALLGDFRERGGRLKRLHRESKAIFSDCLACGAAFWVWQPMPTAWRGEGLAFFAVEQQLYQWGRVGRRVARRCRWRRFWPW